MSTSSSLNHMQILRRKLNTALRLTFGLPHPMVVRTLYGKDFLLTEGCNIEPPDSKWLQAFANHAKVVFDVGANIGQSALPILLSDAVEQIILVEANPEALVTAAKHLIMNSMSMRARFVQAAITSKDNDTVDFWTVGTGSAGSIYRSHAKTAARQGRFFQVRTVTLDTLCNQLGVLPDFVKVDVEGAEVEVLKGSIKCASKQASRFMIEVHSSPISLEDNIRYILAWCEAQKYQAWHLGQNRLVSDLLDPTIMYKTPNRHILLQPADWAYPNWLRLE